MPRSAQEVLSAVRDIAPGIARRAGEIEAANTMPIDIVEDFKAAGIYRMFTPKSHGGLEIDFTDSMQILMELSAADGAAGWVAMLGSHTPVHFSLLPRATYDKIYSSGPDVIASGTYPARGSAEKSGPGTYRASGRWVFASGCKHAEYLYAGIIMHEGGKPLPNPVFPDAPVVRVVVRPAKQWRIHDTWHTQGLRGTGSNDIELQDVEAPEDWFYDFASDQANIPGPLYGKGVPLLVVHNAAVALGVAQGALADAVAMALSAKRRPMAEFAAADHPVLQYELGRLEADFKAARAYLLTETAAYWERAKAGAPLAGTREQHDTLQATMWAVETCVKVVLGCHTLAGTRAIFDSQAIQRRLRDITTLRHHTLTHFPLWSVAGASALGRVTPVPVVKSF